jgi:hypothetical protein
MQNWTGVVPTEFPKPNIVKVSNAISIPIFGRKDPRNDYGSGIFHADGTPIDISLNMVSDHTPAAPIPGVIPTSPTVRRGAWMYGGVLLNHFGHVLMDTTSRLWAIQRLLDDGIPLRGVLFFNKKVRSETDDQSMPKTSAAILDVFNPGLPIVCCNAIEVIEDLYIPEPGISSAPEHLIGRPEQQKFFRNCAAKIAPSDGARDIYISRTGAGARGSHLFEDAIEQAFADEGYFIYKPELFSIKEQIATYRAARRLVSIDGSALHLVAMAIPQNTKVAILSRRQFYAWAIADQFRAFANCDVTVIEAHLDVYNLTSSLQTPELLRTVAGWSSSYVTTNFAHLGQELVHNGFFAQLPKWPAFTAADVSAALARIGDGLGNTLELVPQHLQALEPFYHAHLKG